MKRTMYEMDGTNREKMLFQYIVAAPETTSAVSLVNKMSPMLLRRLTRILYKILQFEQLFKARLSLF